MNGRTNANSNLSKEPVVYSHGGTSTLTITLNEDIKQGLLILSRADHATSNANITYTINGGTSKVLVNGTVQTGTFAVNRDIIVSLQDMKVGDTIHMSAYTLYYTIVKLA